MKLHAKNGVPLDDSGEVPAVSRDGYAIGSDGGGKRMSEIDLCSAFDSREEAGLASDRERIPPDVRHFLALRQARTSSLEEGEARHVGRLIAGLEEPLEAEADSEHGCAVGDRGTNRCCPRFAQGACRLEVPDTGNDDGFRVREVGGSRGRVQVRADSGEALPHRCQISCAVVDQGDVLHAWINPFVLGNTRASRRSREHANRSARANALNSAST
jgi:hypothetical protein